MKKILISILKAIRNFAWAVHSWVWCFFNGVKYKKGVYIGWHVVKKRKVKLVLSEYSRIAYDTLLWGDGIIKIGAHSSIGSCSRIFASKNGGVIIGDWTMSASHLYIIDAEHGIAKGEYVQKQPMTQSPVVIGNGVWFGYKSTVLKGVTLSDGVIVAACACVTKSFPENAIIGGVPAKIIKFRV